MMKWWRLWRLWSAVKAIKGDRVMLDKLKSRKLLAVFLTGVLTTFNGAYQLLPQETMEWLIKLVMVYVVGQGGVDAVAALKKK